MQDDTYDAIIVGAGPGGSYCAALLGKKGRRVLLLDKEKFPRDKACGDAISGKSMKLLAGLGLETAVMKSDHGEYTAVLFSSPNGKSVEIPLKRGQGDLDRSFVCRRMVFDNLLLENAKKHAQVEQAQVTEILRENGKAIGVRAKGSDGKERELHARIVIGADGAGSVAAKGVAGHEVDPDHTCIAHRGYYSGVTGAKCLEIHFLKSIMPGYFWIFPLENGIVNVGVGMMMDDVKAKGVNLGKVIEEIVGKNPMFTARFSNAKLVSPIKAWSLPFGSKKRGGSSDGLLLVGDAFGLVDPFSGEGIGNAMLSGKIAAEVADEALGANDTSSGFLKRYDERVWEAVGGELDTSYKMQQLGKNEMLLNFVVSKAGKSGAAREAIAGTLSSQEAKKGYASPLFYLKLLLS